MRLNGRQDRFSVIIPTLNEADSIASVLERIPDIVDEIIVVDGFSSDRTIQVAKDSRNDVRVLFRSSPGKGNGLIYGFAAATGDIVVALDADGSINPSEIDKLIPLFDEGADVVKGSRFEGRKSPKHLGRLRNFGNAAITWLVNALYGTQYTDVCCGFIAFRKSCLPLFNFDRSGPVRHMPRGGGFEVDALLSIRSRLAGLVVKEIPINYTPRIHGDSKMHPLRDGIRIVSAIVLERILNRSGTLPDFD